MVRKQRNRIEKEFSHGLQQAAKYVTNKMFGKAVEIIDRLKFPESFTNEQKIKASNEIGCLFATIRDFSNASKHFRAALELSPSCLDIHFNLASLLSLNNICIGSSSRSIASLIKYAHESKEICVENKYFLARILKECLVKEYDLTMNVLKKSSNKTQTI